MRKKDTPVELFVEALRNENNGHFETAVVTYESALNAVEKSRFHSYLKNKIIEKIKVCILLLNIKKAFVYQVV